MITAEGKVCIKTQYTAAKRTADGTHLPDGRNAEGRNFMKKRLIIWMTILSMALGQTAVYAEPFEVQGEENEEMLVAEETAAAPEEEFGLEEEELFAAESEDDFSFEEEDTEIASTEEASYEEEESLLAAGADTPAEIQDSYEIDGVTYLNMRSTNFADSPGLWLQTMLGKTREEFQMDGKWMGLHQHWLYLGTLLLKTLTRSGGAAFQENAADAMASAVIYGSGSGGNDETAYCESSNGMLDDRFHSLDAAEEEMYYQMYRNADPNAGSSGEDVEYFTREKAADYQGEYGQYRDSEEDEDVFAAAVCAANIKQGNFVPEAFAGIAVYFTDFKVVTILPEDSGSNYVVTNSIVSGDEDRIVASTISNSTPNSMNASQSVSTSYSVSLSSSISGSKSYSYSKGLDIGMEKDFGFLKASGKVSISASKSVSTGWSESKSESNSSSSSSSVSLTLNPGTRVMMKQRDVTEEQTTIYNCPVALTFTATIVFYEMDNNNNIKPVKVVTFGDDAREDFNQRALIDRETHDRDGINWYDPAIRDDVRMVGEVIAKYVPMSSTGGSFTETLNTVSSEVYGLMPIYPLAGVSLDKPAITYPLDTSFTYLDYSYLKGTMEVGDYSYTSYFSLSGYTAYNMPYYGFSKALGYWIVVDEDGEPWTGNDVPVVLEKDKMTGYTKYRAVRPGRCALKYIINEDVYATADNPTDFAKNEDLFGTATYEIIVNPVKAKLPEGKSLLYSGEEQTGVPESEIYTITGNTGTDAGTYTATLSLRDKSFYVWEDGTTDDKTVTWEITPVNVEIPEGKSLTYNGKKRTGVPAAEDLYTITGNTGTNAKTYTATLTLADKNHVWSDGTTAAKKVSWTIKPVNVSKVTFPAIAKQTYTGKALKPSFTAAFNDLSVDSSVFNLTYSDNKNVGDATLVIEGKGNYKGSKTVTFQILPAGTTLNKLTAASKAITVDWTKQSQKMSQERITGYQIQIAQDSAFTTAKKTYTVSGYSNVNKTLKNLAGGQKYFVRIRTYATIGGTKYCSAWSAAKSVTTGK